MKHCLSKKPFLERVSIVLACVLGQQIAIQAASLSEGLYGYWPLNEGTGTAVRDLSGSHPPGEIRQNDGAAPLGLGDDGGVWASDPQRGPVLGLSGDNAQAYVFLGAETIPIMDLENDFTWSFWSKSDQASNNDIVFGNRYMTNNADFAPREFIKFTNAQFEWHFNGAGQNLDYANIDIQTDWMHHLVVKDGATMTYYRNGVQTVTRTITGAPLNRQPLYIGGQGVENWQGYITEIALYSRALPASEITELHKMGAAGTRLATLFAAEPAKISGRNPSSGGTGAAFDTPITVSILEGSTTLNDSSVRFTVNGQAATHTVGARSQVSPQVKKVDLTVAAPAFPNLYAPGAQVTVRLQFSDSAGAAKDESWTFTVQDYLSVPASWAVADVDTTRRGFRVRTHQLDDRRHILGDRGNRIPPAEEQLAGRIGANIAATAPFTSGGFFIENTYINYNQDETARNGGTSSAGNFGATTTPVKSENPIPGIPGAGDSTDHAAVEILAYLELPAGIVTMGVNSDDGFRLTISPIGAPGDKFGVRVAEFDGGRGAANTEARFVVQQAGRYAMRLMWFEGIGGFNCEWYTRQPDGTPVLINDPAEASAVKAYHARTGPEPTHVSALGPFPFGSTLALAFPDDPIYIEITDGPTPVPTNSITLRVNGQAANPTISKTGGKTAIELNPTSNVWPAGNLDVSLTYGTTVTQSWTIPIMSYVTLEECLRTATGSGQNPGMRWRTHQWDRTGTRGNTVVAAEAQLANEANSADLSLATAGIFNIDYVNFEQDGIADGLIHENAPAPRNAAELPVPGIPGVGSVGNPSDNIVGEALTFIEFPRAGMYYMGMNRDDGFRLTVATTEGGRSLTNGPNVQLVSIYDGGGGIDDNNVQTFMAVNVPQAGVWPMRLLWFEGSGGASVEWFQTNKRFPIGLINDPAVATTLRAFRTRSVQPPANCEAVVQPTIAFARTATGLMLTFAGTLQEADNVTGPFADVAGATSPRTISFAQTRKFYRVRR